MWNNNETCVIFNPCCSGSSIWCPAACWESTLVAVGRSCWRGTDGESRVNIPEVKGSVRTSRLLASKMNSNSDYVRLCNSLCPDLTQRKDADAWDSLQVPLCVYRERLSGSLFLPGLQGTEHGDVELHSKYVQKHSYARCLAVPYVHPSSSVKNDIL